MCGGYAEGILRRKTPEIASLFYFLRKCKKLSSARKIPKLRHFLHFCGGYPLFFRKSCKKNRKKPCKLLCSPLFLCYSATFIDFRGGTSAKPEKSPKLRCFCCGRYKKASSAKRLSKTRKNPEIAWKNDCGGYAEGILRTIFRNFRRFFLQNLRGW